MRYFKILLPLIVLICSCTGNQQETLIGNWSAISVVQNDKPLKIEMTEVSFQFNADNTYHFNSTLNYKEAGTYSLEEDKLYTLDTLNQGTIGKIVMVEKLVSDTLQLKMKNESDWMQVILTKSKK